MAVLTAINSFSYRAQGFYPVARKIDLFGFNRTAVLERLKSLRLDPLKQRQLIQTLAQKRIIKSDALERIRDLADLTETDLSVKITSQRLNGALKQFNAFSGEQVGSLEVAPLSHAVFGETVSNTLWDIGDALTNLLEVLGSQSRFIRKISSHGQAHIFNRNRNIQMMRLLFILATNFAGLEEAQKIDQNWYDQEVDGMPKEAKDFYRGFLSTEGNFMGQVHSGYRELLSLMENEGWLRNPHSISKLEGEFQKQVRSVIEKVAEDRRQEETGHLSAEALQIRRQERAEELLALLDKFGDLGDMSSAMKESVAGLRLIVESSLQVLNTGQGTEEQKEAIGTLISATRNAVWDMRGLIVMKPKKHLLLKLAAIAAIFATIAYLGFRIVTTVMMLTGTMPENSQFFFEGPVSHTIMGTLLTGELFFDTLALIYMGNVWQAINQADGSDGDSWTPRVRKGLARDYKKRARMAHMMVLVDEPTIAITPANASHIKAALWHGNADLILADNSRYAYNKIGGASTVSLGKKMVARVKILKQFIIHNITPRLGEEEADLVAHYLSVTMGSEYTEADDAECQVFAFERTKEVLRQFRVPTKHVEKIGREIGRKVMAANQGVTTEERGSFLQNPLSIADLTQMITKAGVPMEKALVMAQMIKAELDTIVRRSRLAKTTTLILQGQNPDQEIIEAFKQAIREESGLTDREADQLVTGIITHREGIKQAAAWVVSECDFTAKMATRRAYDLIYRVAEEFMRQDKRINIIEEGLGQKLSHIIQKVLFMESRPVTSRIPLRSGYLLGRCQVAAADIGRRIANLAHLTEVREGFIEEGKSFQEAEERAWAGREKDIERIVLEEVFVKGNDYGISEEEAKMIAKGIISEYRANREVRKQTAHEFAQQVFAAYKRVFQAAGKKEEEKTIAAVVDGVLGAAREEKGIMLELLIDDLPGLNIGRDHPFRARLKQVLGKFDPTTQKETLEKALQREFGFSARQAVALADAYAVRYLAIIGNLTAAVEQMHACGGQISPIAVKEGPNVTTAPGDVVYFGAVKVDLTEIKKEADERVKQPAFNYTWGAKGGTINALLLGDSIPQNIGEISRWVVHRLIGEKFFQKPLALSPQQAGSLSAGRIRELNDLLGKVRQTEVPPELIAYLDHHMVGHHKYLIPPVSDPRFLEPDFVASYIVSRLTAAGTYRLKAGGTNKVTAAQIAAELFDLWGIGGMSRADKQRFGFTGQTRRELYDKVLYLTGEVQVRLGFAAFVNVLGARPNCDVAAEVRRIGERTGLTEKQAKALTKRAKQAADLLARGWITINGTGNNCFMQITARASRDIRIDEILLGHYRETLENYSGLVESHNSSAARELELIREHRKKGTVSDLEALHRLLFNEEEEKALKLRSITAVVSNKEQFVTKVLELEIQGKSLEQGRKALLEVLGIRGDLALAQQDQVEEAINAAKEEVLRKFGVFFSPLMDSIIGGFVENPNQDFSNQISTAIRQAAFLTAEEKTAFGNQAVAFVKMLQDLQVKAKEEGALEYHETTAENGGSRLGTRFNFDLLSVRQRHKAQKRLEQLQYYSISVVPSTAVQVAEDIMIKSQIPLVTVNRESFGLEVRQCGAAIDALWSKVRAEVAEEAERLEAQDLSRAEMVRQLTEFTVKKLGETMDASAQLPGKINYFSEKFKDGQYEVPLRAECSTLDYAGYHVDDADYRVNLTCLTDLAQYIEEHPGYVHFGNRQFGRNYRKSSVANGFQSGQNAYWSWTNEANSLKGLTPSWGAQMIYSGRVYRNGAHYIWEDYHKGAIKDKFLLKDKWKKAERAIGSRILKMGAKKALAFSFGFQIFNLAITKAAWLLDIPIVVLIHAPRDFIHFLAEKGKWFMPQEFLGLHLEKVIEKEKIIDKTVNTMLAAQDATTESEDIASDIWFLRMAPFLMDETRSKGLKWLKAQFSITGTYHLAKEMFSSAWIPGIAGLGAHSDDKRGKDVTFDGRWLRGNAALTFTLLTTKYGLWRKLSFLSLSLFWGKGIMKPALILPPLAFLGLGAAGVGIALSTSYLITFFALAFGSFIFNMGVFLGSMAAKGYFNRGELHEGGGCLLMDWTGMQRQAKSAWEGFMLRTRPGFVPSPKEAIAPAKAWSGALAADYTFMTANFAGMAVAAQTMLQGGSPLYATLIFWCGFHGIHQGIALWKYNKGIFIPNPAIGAQPANLQDAITKSLYEYLTRYYPRYKANVSSGMDPLINASEEGEKEREQIAA